MIIANAEVEGGKLLALALSKANLEKLAEGVPLHVRRKSEGSGIPEGWNLLLFTGETVEDMNRVMAPYLPQPPQPAGETEA